VSITSDRSNAVIDAMRFHDPMIYEVTLRDEPIPDDVLPGYSTEKRVPSARVWKAETPTRNELAAGFATLSMSSPQPEENTDA
jgi:hypothetical protein